MNYNFFKIVKNFIAIFYYKIFKNVYGRGYERYKIDLIKKKIKKIKYSSVSYIDERIVEIP